MYDKPTATQLRSPEKSRPPGPFIWLTPGTRLLMGILWDKIMKPGRGFRLWHISDMLTPATYVCS
jgi:hypothetical protein